MDYQKNKFDIADSKDSQNQIEALRTALFKAIGEPNFDKVIELVGRGANPNYGFHSMEEEYFVHSGGGGNLKGLSPAHFACLFLKGNQAKEMFELLLDLGTKMRFNNLQL